MIKTKFEELTKKYGAYGSWAIWDKNNDVTSTDIIFQNYNELHSKYVIVALNKSFPSKKEWQNFRGKRKGCHDRKLVKAFNIEPFYGSYMTDLFKNTHAKSVYQLKIRIKDGNIKINKNVNLFIKEMQDIGLNSKSVIIVFGKFGKKMFENHFQNQLQLRPQVIFHEHYSSTHKTDKEWVTSIHKELGFDIP